MPEFRNGVLYDDDGEPVDKQGLHNFTGLRQWGLNPEPWRKCVICGVPKASHSNIVIVKAGDVCSYCKGTGIVPGSDR